MNTGVASGLASYLASLPLADGSERVGWSVGGFRPEAVAFPRSADELAQVLGRATEEGWSVVPAGGGGWIGGGGVPRSVDLVVSTREMSRVVEYESDDLTLTAEAGLGLGTLIVASREHGQWLPQDPPGWPSSTLGAFVSTGLPGPLVAGFGRPRDHLLGLTAVSGDGRILRPGGKVVKNVAGFDLVRLLTGSWGCLAVVAEAAVRLFPLPRRDVTLVLEAEDPRELVEPGRALATASVVPDALELVWGWPEASGRAVLAARILGSPEAVEEKARILLEALSSAEPGRLEGEDSRRIHRALARVEPGPPAGRPSISLRLSSLPAHLGELVEGAAEIERVAREPGTGGDGTVRAAASVTRGTIRLEVAAPGRSGDPFHPRRWAPVLRDIRESLSSSGGRLTLLHGPEALLDAVGSRDLGGGSRALMTGIHKELDPAGILAPGRLTVDGGPT